MTVSGTVQESRWVYMLLLLLGLWLALSPLTFDYGRCLVEPAGGRPTPFSAQTRTAVAVVNAVVAGAVVLAAAWRARATGRIRYLWVIAAAGVWLNAAPLVFWAPSALAYYAPASTGTVLLFVAMTLPGMPGLVAPDEGPTVPRGWSYNPSAWSQRSSLVLLAFLGWMAARYLTSYQMGYTGAVWEPFFGVGSRRVLDSHLSASLPVSDGGLGAFSYTLEFVMGWVGGTARWRTMPWLVLLFGVFVIPVGLAVHMALVSAQPLVVGHWCTVCLLTAFFMLLMIPLEIDEVAATLQVLKEEVRAGRSLGAALLHGVTDPSCGEQSALDGVRSLEGVSLPWTLGVSALAGLWLLAAPGSLGIGGAARAISIIAGVFILSVSVISMAEVVRGWRFANIPVGIALAVSVLFTKPGTPGTLNALVAGGMVVLLSLPRGTIRGRYGGGAAL